MKKFNQALARMGFAVFFISFCSVAVAETSCKQELGAAKAQELVEQCINISPATHPPCNIENSCAMIQRGIDHGCNFAKLYGGEVPSYCNVAQDSQASTSAQTQTDQGQQYFKSPSGNIACAFGDGSENFPDHVRCDIYKFTPSYEVPDELKNVIWKELTCGGGHTCAVDENGWPACWGFGQHGQVTTIFSCAA